MRSLRASTITTRRPTTRGLRAVSPTKPRPADVTSASPDIFLPVYVCPQGTAVVGHQSDYRQHRGSGHRVGMPKPRRYAGRRRRAQPEQPIRRSGPMWRCCRRCLPKPLVTTTNAKTYRAAIGAHGEFGGGWSYNVGATASKVTLGCQQPQLLVPAGPARCGCPGDVQFRRPECEQRGCVRPGLPGGRKQEDLQAVAGPGRYSPRISSHFRAAC